MIAGRDDLDDDRRRVGERGCAQGSRSRQRPHRPCGDHRECGVGAGHGGVGALDDSPQSLVSRSWPVVVPEAGDHPRRRGGRDHVSDRRERLGCGKRVSGLGKCVRVGAPNPDEHAERHRQMRGDVGHAERPHQWWPRVEPGMNRRFEEQPEPTFRVDQATHPPQRALRAGGHGRDDRRERKGEQDRGGIARRPRPTRLRRHAATVDDRDGDTAWPVGTLR